MHKDPNLIHGIQHKFDT